MDDKIVIAVDVDGTIFDNDVDFPKVGRIKEGAVECLKKLKELGCEIVIWSGRNNSCINGEIDRLEGLLNLIIALIENNVPFDKVDWGDCGKYVADIYIDDKAVRFDGNWYDVFEKVKEIVQLIAQYHGTENKVFHF